MADHLRRVAVLGTGTMAAPVTRNPRVVDPWFAGNLDSDEHGPATRTSPRPLPSPPGPASRGTSLT